MFELNKQSVLRCAIHEGVLSVVRSWACSLSADVEEHQTIILVRELVVVFKFEWESEPGLNQNPGQNRFWLSYGSINGATDITLPLIEICLVYVSGCETDTYVS